MRPANVHPLHIWEVFDASLDCWGGGKAPSCLLVTRCEGQNTIMEIHGSCEDIRKSYLSPKEHSHYMVTDMVSILASIGGALGLCLGFSIWGGFNTGP